MLVRAGDGMHLTPDGGDVIAQAVYEHLDPLCDLARQAVPGAGEGDRRGTERLATEQPPPDRGHHAEPRPPTTAVTTTVPSVVSTTLPTVTSVPITAPVTTRPPPTWPPCFPYCTNSPPTTRPIDLPGHE